MYMLLISSCACWICIEHQIDVITLSPPHQKCNAIIGDDIVILLCRDLCVASCSCLCLFLHCIKKKTPLLSPINNLFIPAHHLILNESSIYVYFLDQRVAPRGRRPLFILQTLMSGRWCLRTGEMIAGWRMVKARSRYFKSNTECICCRTGRTLFFDMIKRKKQLINRYERTPPTSPQKNVNTTLADCFNDPVHVWY